jgi:hypothetical protein
VGGGFVLDGGGFVLDGSGCAPLRPDVPGLPDGRGVRPSMFRFFLHFDLGALIWNSCGGFSRPS